jgi:ferredoxin
MHKVSYFGDVIVEDVPDCRTLLDVSIGQRIPHLHQCGARGRCTTCRIQVLDGISHVSARNPLEKLLPLNEVGMSSLVLHARQGFTAMW